MAMMPRQESRPASRYIDAALLTGIVLLALLLRVLFLGKESLWLDEAYSVEVAGTGSWGHLAGRLWNSDANMSLYYALLHIWIGLGRTEFVVRALSVLFAAISIPLVYLLGDKLLGRRTGILASFILALNVFHIEYAQEARSYSLLVLLTILASLLFVSAIRRPSSKAWSLYSGAIVLGIYAHLFAVFVLAAQWLSLTIRRRDVPWRAVTLSALAIGVLLAPLAVFALTNEHGQISWIPRPRPDLVPRLFTYLAGASPVTGVRFNGALFVAAEATRRLLALFYAACVGIALIRAGRLWFRQEKPSETWAYAFLLLWLLAPPILAYLISLIKPIFVFYYLIVSLAPLVILAADGLSRIRPTGTRAAAMVALASLAAVQVSAYYHFPRKEDWRGATRYILSRAQADDSVVFADGFRSAFEYYRDRYGQKAPGSVQIRSLSDALRQGPPGVWLVIAHISDAETATVQSRLARRYVVADRQRFFGGIQILLYKTKVTGIVQEPNKGPKR
jgi:mannosyltransferase